MFTPPEVTGTPALTDWVEASCMFGDRGSVSRADVEDALEAAGYSDLESESAVDDIWLEIQRRERIGGPCYPLKPEIERIFRTRRWEDEFSYSILLLIACVSHYRGDVDELEPGGVYAELFEDITTIALANHLKGRAVRFGAPRRAPLPTGYGDALGFLCREIEEDVSSTPTFSPHPKDEKVDVVAWIPFGDQRPGKVLLLAQCATGRRWETKAWELDVAVWHHFVRWPRDPSKALAIPFVCPPAVVPDDPWFRASSHCGVLLDRLRLVIALAERSPEVDVYVSSEETFIRARTTAQTILAALPRAEA